MSAALLLPAMLLDAALGEPKWIWNRYPHPAVLMGGLVGWCDRRFNTGRNTRLKGAAVMAALAVGAMVANVISVILLIIEMANLRR